MKRPPLVEGFFEHKRLAVVGVSRNPKEFSRAVFRELLAQGYDVVGVNPTANEVDGRPCFSRLQDVSPPIEAALFLTPPTMTERLIQDCPEAGVRWVWLHKGAGAGAVSPASVEFCRTHGIQVVAGACPFMFLPHAGFGHRLHGLVLRILGRQPGH